MRLCFQLRAALEAESEEGPVLSTLVLGVSSSTRPPQFLVSTNLGSDGPPALERGLRRHPLRSRMEEGFPAYIWTAENWVRSRTFAGACVVCEACLCWHSRLAKTTHGSHLQGKSSACMMCPRVLHARTAALVVCSTVRQMRKHNQQAEVLWARIGFSVSRARNCLPAR